MAKPVHLQCAAYCVALRALAAALAWSTFQVLAQSLPPPSPAPTVRLEYDARGNLKRVTQDPGAQNLSAGTDYDRLERPVRGIDARGKPTGMAYDGRDHLVQVTDPRLLATRYLRTGLGDLTGLISPDTGTATHALDAAGNLRNRTDSRGAVATYTHDALNRLTGATYVHGNQSQVLVWRYDQVGPGFSHGVGRLTSTQFPGGASSFGYDPQGRLTRMVQTVSADTTVTLGVSYGHDSASHVTSMTYPSGRVVYFPHAGGLPSSVSVAPGAGSAALPLLSGLQFEPGTGASSAVRSWQWELNNGRMPHQREFDVHGRMVRYPLGGVLRGVTYDAADRIAGYIHWDAMTGTSTQATRPLDQAFGHDETGRLASVATSGGTWRYAYDDNGNRTVSLFSTAGTAFSRAHHIDVASNRLLGVAAPARSFSYDAAGNMTSTLEGGRGWTAVIDPQGRIQSIGSAVSTAGGDAGAGNWVHYIHDTFGLRIAKLSSGSGPALGVTPTPPGAVICLDATGVQSICPAPPLPTPDAVRWGVGASGFAGGNSTGIDSTASMGTSSSGSTAGILTVYVHGQNGELLGEYDGRGTVLREYIWLQGMPVAVIDGPAARPQIYYVQTDHIDTPRVLLDRSGRQRWTWVAEPFGNSLPIENPIGLGPVKLNLRMPGQYHDEESGLSYNWNRSYDSGVGRYTQSDPIGLAGGINTYAYVQGNPVSLVDPTGELAWGFVFGGADLAWQLYQTGGNLRCVNWRDVGLSMLSGGLLNALGKGAFRAKTVGSHTWNATRSWMNRRGIQTPGAGQQRHHWLFERNQGIGRNVPDAIKNQPFNTNPISAEFNNWLSRHPELAWMGGPSWAGEVAGGGAMAVAGGGDDCTCKR